VIERFPLANAVDSILELTVAPSWSRIGFDIRRNLLGWDQSELPSLAGRVMVLTGFTSGIGLAAATRLGELGATLHLVGRNPERVAAVVEQLHAISITATASVADLSNLDDVSRLAREIRAEYETVDVLVHNAGALSREFTQSAQGYELTVAAQVLGPFLLTQLLLDPLRASSHGGRVITVTSGGMYTERLSVADMEMSAENYNGVRAYARAKRAQVELAAEWSRRIGPSLAFHTMHPGWADTPGVVDSLPTFYRFTRPLLREASAGADTIVWLASAASIDLGASGGLWLDRRRRSTSRFPWTETPAGERYRLWSWCEERTSEYLTQ